MPSQPLDATDWKIFGRRYDDARISNIDLPCAVNLSLRLNHVRMLEASSFVSRYVTRSTQARVDGEPDSSR